LLNGDDASIRDFAIALLQSGECEVVLVLDGKANPKNPKSSETLAEYRCDDTGKGDQILVLASEKPQQPDQAIHEKY
jgi:hypothetical protein